MVVVMTTRPPGSVLPAMTKASEDEVDSALHLAANPDVALAFDRGVVGNGVEHWRDAGRAEQSAGSRPSLPTAMVEAVTAIDVEPDAAFDTASYVAMNEDLARAFGADTEAARRHWAEHGRVEARFGAGDAPYRKRAPDLAALLARPFGVDLYLPIGEPTGAPIGDRILSELRRAQIPVTLRPHVATDDRPRLAADEAVRAGSCRISMIAASPVSLGRLMRAYPSGHFDRSYVIGLWDVAPVSVHMTAYGLFGALDEVWVSSEAARVRLASVSPVPVRYVRLPVRPLPARNEARAALGLDPDVVAIMLDERDVPPEKHALDAIVGAVGAGGALLLIRARPGSTTRLTALIGAVAHVRVHIDQAVPGHGSLILGAVDALIAAGGIDTADARGAGIPLVRPLAASIEAFLSGPSDATPESPLGNPRPVGDLLSMLGLDRPAPAFATFLGRSKHSSLPVPSEPGFAKLSPTLPVVSILLDGRAASRADIVRVAAACAASPHPFWELCVAGTDSLSRLSLPPDPRIRLAVATRDPTMAGLLDRAASIATGTHVLVARSTTEALAAAASLAAIAASLVAQPDIDLLLPGAPCSIDRIQTIGQSLRPVVIRRSALLSAGAFHGRHDTVAEYELLLALSRSSIGFCVDAAPARDPDLPDADEAARLALGEHLRTTVSPLAVVEPGLLPGTWRRRTRRLRLPQTTMIIPTTSKLAPSDLPAGTTMQRNGLADPHAAYATEYLVFLDGPIARLAPDALPALLGYAEEAEIGAVGGRVLNHDGTLSQAGLMLRAEDGALEPADPALALSVHNPDAIGAVLAIRRSILLEAGGFDTALSAAAGVSFDLLVADLCLRLARDLALRVTYTPFAVLTRAPVSPALDDDHPRAAADILFARRWSR